MCDLRDPLWNVHVGTVSKGWKLDVPWELVLRSLLRSQKAKAILNVEGQASPKNSEDTESKWLKAST